MLSHSARKSVRDSGCLIWDREDLTGVSAKGLALYVGPDATDEQLIAVANSQLALYAGCDASRLVATDRHAVHGGFPAESVR